MLLYNIYLNVLKCREAVQTVSGRMGSSNFNFNIREQYGAKRLVEVSKAQIEIDGGYESYNEFILIEAKNEAVDDFLIRQLYYPI